MNIFEMIMIAVGLAMDACAVSVAAGTSGKLAGKRATFRLSFHFGLFQAMMPVIGWFAGTRIAHLISAVDHLVAFGLLVFVGGEMIITDPFVVGLLAPGKPVIYAVEVAFAVGVIVCGKLWMKKMMSEEQASDAEKAADSGR